MPKEGWTFIAELIAIHSIVSQRTWSKGIIPCELYKGSCNRFGGNSAPLLKISCNPWSIFSINHDYYFWLEEQLPYIFFSPLATTLIAHCN